VSISLSPVPSGSSPLRELARAVDRALRLPEPWPSDLDEELFLRLSRDRADVVCQAMNRIISGRQIQAGPGDAMAVAAWLDDQAAALPADIYRHEGSLR